jgi:hypothetical protein
VPQVRATRHAERILATAAALSRVGALLLLTAAAVHVLGAPARYEWLALTQCAGLAVESVALVVLWLRRGELPVRPAAVDAAVLITVVTCTANAWGTGSPAGQTPLYNFVMIAVVGMGLARWRLPAVLGAGLLLSAANMSPSVISHAPRYPVRLDLGDSLTLLGSVVLIWIVGNLVRGSAASVDRYASDAVARAAELTLVRVRAAHAEALSTHVLATLRNVIESGVHEPALREHLRAEERWLRDLLSGGRPDGPELLRGLTALAAEKSVGGFTVRLSLPEREPVRSPEEVAGLIGATREALTNVERHAGVTEADVTVTVAQTGLTVEIVDAGRGYDLAVRSSGTGQRQSIRQRLADLGGSALIASIPGAGTRVTLRVPGPGPGPGHGVR